MSRKLTRAAQADKDESIKILQGLCPPGTEIVCVLAHCSRSGMRREIKLYAVTSGGLEYIAGHAARALGDRRGPRDGIIVDGCGMDMGFHLVNALSYTLHGHKPVGADAEKADADGGSMKARPGHYRPGYSLTHRWL